MNSFKNRIKTLDINYAKYALAECAWKSRNTRRIQALCLAEIAKRGNNV